MSWDTWKKTVKSKTRASNNFEINVCMRSTTIINFLLPQEDSGLIQNVSLIIVLPENVAGVSSKLLNKAF